MAVSAPDAESEHARELPKPGPHVLVLFGATGDLARRKLIPGPLPPRAGRADARRLPDRRRLAGRARRRGASAPTSATRSRSSAAWRSTSENWKTFSERLSYVPSKADALAAGVAKAEEAIGDDARRLYYLSVPPSAAGPIVRTLGEAGLTERARVVMEKPFGTDLDSAQRAQRDGARGVRRGPDLQDRPLPGQGSGAEHAGPAVRQRLPRAAVEPRAHRPRADRRARDARRSARAASSTRARAPSAT